MSRLKYGLSFLGLSFAAVIFYLTRCHHSNISFPQSQPRGKGSRLIPAAHRTGKYVTCLDCGKEFPYDWNKMQVLNRIRDQVGAA